MSTLANPSLPSVSAEEAPALLIQMINGFWITQMIHVVAVLGIADLLAGGPKTGEELAQATSSHPTALPRLLRTLASLGIFAEEEDGRFSLTPLADLLRADEPGSLRAWALLQGDPQTWLPWGDLMYSIQTGEDAFGHVFGLDNWQYRQQHPEAGKLFQEAMSANTGRQASEVLAAYDFADIAHLVDVGGGHGTLIAAVLQARPQMRGTLFDLPHVAAGARSALAAAGVAERCDVVGGSFFDTLPVGGDAYIMKWILHDWDDEHCLAILHNCRQAISPAGRLLLVERVIRPGNGPDPARLRDINMLVQNPGGRERTPEDFRDLFAQAGFALSKICPTAGELSVIEGVPVAA